MKHFRYALIVCLGCSAFSVALGESDTVRTVSVPQAWRKVPTGQLTPTDGYSWYRAAVQIPADWQGADLLLHVESLDDVRATFFNGVQVGISGTFPPRYRSGLGEPGRFRVDADRVRPGQLNVVAIRVFQRDPRPNFSVAPPTLVNGDRKEGIRLAGNWQYVNRDDQKFPQATADDFERSDDSEDADVVYADVEAYEDLDEFVTRREGDQQPLSPAEAEQSFDVPDDLAFQLVLSEPEIAQPLFMTWDEAGRLWVVEYRQYPEVAGAKMVSRDVYLRSVYDKVPEPPPHGAKGRDRISVHEDSDGDGVYDQHRTFVDGLNLATSVAIGRGGVFVTNPPYLLFYPDEDRDLVPDRDPEVLLEGFGLEDSHSVINSLRFGPDGWLYGAQGSTVSAEVKRPGSAEEPVRTMGQQIWRYHPESRRFEVFAEGGGNTFGVEIDSRGRVYSGHNGGNTRGFHYVQGGYYRKGFSKHGALSNPFAFGYFSAMKHADVPRFTHNFIIYEEGVLPAEYEGRLFGIEPLQGQVVMSHVRPRQSSFETEDISRVVKTDDQWFRPVDIKAGPDGCIYVADMYEQRIDHSSHYAGRIDRSNGRIYRLRPKQMPQVSTAVADPVAALSSPQRSHRQTALRMLGDAAESGKPLAENAWLLKKVQQADGQTALEHLWALNLTGGLNESSATALLDHPEPSVREWTVRLMCDRLHVPSRFLQAMITLSADETDIQVRKQLASSARRIPTDAALPIIANLLRYSDDADDIHQPLLIWWAVEHHVTSGSASSVIEQFAESPELTATKLFRQHLAERLIKRLVMAESRTLQTAAATLLNAANDKSLQATYLKGIEAAFQGRSLQTVPEPLLEAVAAAGGGSPLLQLRRGDPAAVQSALADVQNSGTPQERRQNILAVLAETPRPEFLVVLLGLIETESNAEITSAALTALQVYDDDRVPRTVIERFATLPDQSRRSAESLLASRVEWASAALSALAKGQLSVDDFSSAFPRQVLLHQQQQLTSLVKQHWPNLAATDMQKAAAEIARIQTVLAEGTGSPKQGKPIFAKHCGRCHRLFDEGGRIGPDLTAFKRDDAYRMLQSIVAPSLEVREGFETYTAVTADGRLVTGFKADEDSQVLILRGADGQNVVLRKAEIDDVVPSKVSLMPQDILRPFNDQQLRDLFAYLRSSQPVNY